MVRRLRARGPLRPGSDPPPKLSWVWGLVPPVAILARTRAAHSTRLIPFVLYCAIAYPVVWFMPEEWVSAVAGSVNGLSSGAAAAIETFMQAIGIN